MNESNELECARLKALEGSTEILSMLLDLGYKNRWHNWSQSLEHFAILYAAMCCMFVDGSGYTTDWHDSMQGRCIVTRRYYEPFKTTPESLETNVLRCVSTNFVSCRGNKTNMTQMTASDHQLHEWRQLFAMFYSLTWSVPDSWWV